MSEVTVSVSRFLVKYSVELWQKKLSLGNVSLYCNFCWDIKDLFFVIPVCKTYILAIWPTSVCSVTFLSWGKLKSEQKNSQALILR